MSGRINIGTHNRRRRLSVFLRSGVAALAAGGSIAAVPGIAAADATDAYPIPNRMLKTSCTAEQIMAAARDVEPVYYERYMIDYNNKSPDIQQGAKTDSLVLLDGLCRTPGVFGAHRDEFLGEPMAFRWPNWAKLFFNNKGVAADTTDICAQYPPNDMSVWNW